MKKTLIITNEEDPHVDIVVPLLGTNVFRVNTEKILDSFRYYANISNHQTSEVYFENALGEKLFLNQVASIWYRRPEKPIIESSSELDEVRIGESWGGLYHFLHSMNNVPWMGHPFEDKVNSSRVLQLSTAVNLGFMIPDTIISRDSVKIRSFLCKHPKIAIKPLHERGKTLDGYWTPYFTEVREAKQLLLLDDKTLSSTYNYMQEYIEKKREWRITIVGGEVFPCVIESQNNENSKLDWRRENIDNLTHYFEKLPESIEKKIIEYCELLGLNFGAMDLIETPEGDWCFLECNPNGQWLWIEHKTNLKISEAIANWHSRYL